MSCRVVSVRHIFLSFFWKWCRLVFSYSFWLENERGEAESSIGVTGHCPVPADYQPFLLVCPPLLNGWLWTGNSTDQFVHSSLCQHVQTVHLNIWLDSLKQPRPWMVVMVMPLSSHRTVSITSSLLLSFFFFFFLLKETKQNQSSIDHFINRLLQCIQSH